MAGCFWPKADAQNSKKCSIERPLSVKAAARRFRGNILEVALRNHHKLVVARRSGSYKLRAGQDFSDDTRQECKRPQKGPSTFWRRGWDGRCAPSLAAAPLPESNRVRKPVPHSARNQKRGHKGPIFNFWRRGWDSNPRKATNLCWFSRPVHSTTLPPLQSQEYVNSGRD